MEQTINKFELSNRVFVLVVVLILGILGYFVANINHKFQTIEPLKEFTVSGEGRVFAKPDIALLNLGVKSEAKDVSAAIRENTEKMNLVLIEIKNLGIEEKDTQTIRYDLRPRYDWLEGRQVFRGYVLEQGIRVKIRNFEKIGEVIERTTAKGANLVGDLSFDIDDPEDLRAKAREEAINRAKEKAEKIAQQSGIRLRKIINVYEGRNYHPMPRAMDLERFLAPPTPEAVRAPEILPGEREIVVQISLVYRIE